METLKGQTVGEIVAEDYRTAGVFKKFGLDFCCGGDRLVADVCKSNGVNIEELSDELHSLSAGAGDTNNYKEWTPQFLADYIINNHHQYVRTKAPEIQSYAQKVAKVHGRNHPELKEMLDVFLTLKDEMLSHIDKEERVLFPYVKKLSGASANGGSVGQLQFGTPAEAIAMLEEEHEETGELMERLNELSDGFSLPEDACTTYRIYFQNLEAFEDDLHKHVHLENNILFHKVLDMEHRLN